MDKKSKYLKRYLLIFGLLNIFVISFTVPLLLGDWLLWEPRNFSDSTLLAVAGKHLRLAFFVKGDDIVMLRGRAVYLHARRAHRHAWHSQSGDGGALFQQALDFSNGNMSLYYVAVHDGSVAGLQLRWNLMVTFYFGEVVDIFNLHRITISFHIVNPSATAASGRGTIDGNDWPVAFFGRLFRSSWCRARGEHNNH